ncbi:putative subtilisin-like serine peptidase [Trypanosoma conorhini]|uniref:Putative subtilisin-like serine peptidase n=1 Tax=Trypanosoma conorhini TaxID=83891 RepID=A0A3R7L5S7_9TRYP|nr:putative subtilisin-like serine peptidase [Trypanosoma conorhini]RNF21629.1 putative subtilisin-like serine peptidase [Trypanosoma conorhini]
MSALSTLLAVLALCLLCGTSRCAAAAAAESSQSPAWKRSPLQKWLGAEWSQKHEAPLYWFLQQQHHHRQPRQQYIPLADNSTSHLAAPHTPRRVHGSAHTARMAGVAGAGAWPLESNYGRYIIVRLGKLSRGERRKVWYALMKHGLEDIHIIDELHMLVYVDSPRANRLRRAVEAADDGAAPPLSLLTVLDVYSTSAGAHLKLSRVLRRSMNSCGALHGAAGRGGEEDFNRLAEHGSRWRLPLDVRTAVGREEVVEESLRGVLRKAADVSVGCRWDIVSSPAGKGHVRWVLALASQGRQDGDEEASLICRCAAFIHAVVRHPAVRWMEVAVEQVAPLNFHATALVQHGEQDEAQPFRPFWGGGINGSGELIGVADSGVDFDSCFFHDPKESVTLYPKVNHRHRKVVSFVPSDLFPGEVLIGDKERGHGTHVAGTVAGHMLGNGENSKYDGVAKGAKLFFTSLGARSQSMLTLPVDITDVFRPGYKEGAHIFSNSWGFFAPGEYTAVEKSMDSLASQMEDALIIFAAGNTPNSGLLTPCRAKNMICIGAHKNSFDRYEQNIIAGFSSPGPTYDHRVKPELVTPGDSIISALSDGNISTRQCTVVSMRGTSMATAALAGSAALMRHHLRKLENVSSPSAALLKALLIHATVNLNNSRMSGFGRLDMSLFFTPTGIRGWFRDRNFIDHHTSNVHHFTLGPVSPEVDEMVRVTLAWTDLGAAMEGSLKSLVNDLDVVVVDSTGVLHFAGSNNTLDTTNVMEQIRLPPSWELAAGFRVLVYGGSVHAGIKQPYALVVSGPSLRYVGDADVMPNVRCANNCSGHGDCVGGVCKCHAGYRFVDCSICDEETVCHGHGTCEAKELRCTCDNEHFADANCSSCKSGWYGPSCSSDCKCSNRGKCDVVTGECACPMDKNVGWIGVFRGSSLRVLLSGLCRRKL